MKPEPTKKDDVLEKIREKLIRKGEDFYRKYQDKAFQDVIKR